MLVYSLAHTSVTCTVAQQVVSLNTVLSVLKTQQIVVQLPLPQIQPDGRLRHHQLSPAVRQLRLHLLPQTLKHLIPCVKSLTHFLRLLHPHIDISGQQMREV